jgi:hypothetical protein
MTLMLASKPRWKFVHLNETTTRDDDRCTRAEPVLAVFSGAIFVNSPCQIMDRAVKGPVATECIVFRLFNTSSLGVPWWRTQVYLMFPTVIASQQTAAQSQLLPSEPLRLDHSFASRSFIWVLGKTRRENGSVESGTK